MKLFGFLLIGIFISSCSSTITDINTSNNELIELSAAQIKEAKAQLGSITPKAFGQQVNANGYIETSLNNEQYVTSLQGGRVAEITVENGQKVHKGQTLIILENPEFVEMQRAYLEAGFEVNKLKEQWIRKQNLAKDQIVSTSELQMAEAAYLSAVARYNALAENLRLLQIEPSSIEAQNLSATIKVKSLINGTITDINCRKGQWIAPEDLLIHVVDLEKLRLKLDVFEKDIQKLSENLPLKAVLPDRPNKQISGNIQTIGREIDAYNRTVKVYAGLVPDPEVMLMPGMFLHANIQLESKQMPALPETAFLESDEKNYLLVLQKEENGSWFFEKKQAITGESANGFVAIINYEDFAPDAKILITGGFQILQEGE